MARPLSGRSPFGRRPIFRLRATVAIAVVSHHPPPHSVALIGPAVGLWMHDGSDGAVFTIVGPQTPDPTPNPADRECMEFWRLYAYEF
jgi:hypothetical protein